MSSDPLFSPFSLAGVRLANRLMVSAHEPNYAEDGLPTERYVRYHEERAKGGVALTMTAGSAVVSRDSPAAFGNLHLYRDEIVAPLRQLKERCQQHGTAVMIQITHLGRRTRWDQGDWLPLVSASGVRERAHRATPKALEAWDAERIVGDYCAAGERVKAAGFDGIELIAYGHLIDSFWSPDVNNRNDEHSNSFDNRLRFTKQLLAAMRKQLGETFPLGIRMSLDEQTQHGFNTETGIAIAKALCAPESHPRCDFLNVIRGRIDTDAALSHVIPSAGMRASPHIDFAGLVKQALPQVPVLHAGRIATLADARYAIREGKVDVVGMTRAHLAEPHIARLAKLGAQDDIRPCVGASYCIDRLYLGQDALCIHNAASGREQRMPHDEDLRKRKSPTQRKVVVVGAGPAGLEAARVCLEKGLPTTIFEAADSAGGQVRLLAQGRRSELKAIVEWRLARIENLHGSIHYNRFLEPEEICSMEADIVLVATGGSPQKPPLDYGEELAQTGWEIFAGAKASERHITVYDDNGAQAGVQLAEMLASEHCQVHYVTPERTLAPDIGGLTHAETARVFAEKEIATTINARLIGVACHEKSSEKSSEKNSEKNSENRLRLELGSDYAPGKKQFLETDRLFVEHATQANDALYHALCPLSCNGGAVDQKALLAGEPQSLRRNEEGTFQLFRIGDAVAARNIHAAIYDALRLCKDF